MINNGDWLHSVTVCRILGKWCVRFVTEGKMTKWILSRAPDNNDKKPNRGRKWALN